MQWLLTFTHRGGSGMFGSDLGLSRGPPHSRGLSAECLRFGPITNGTEPRRLISPMKYNCINLSQIKAGSSSMGLILRVVFSATTSEQRVVFVRDVRVMPQTHVEVGSRLLVFTG